MTVQPFPVRLEPVSQAAAGQQILDGQLKAKSEQLQAKLQASLIEAGLDASLAPLAKVEIKRQGTGLQLTVDTSKLYTTLAISPAIAHGIGEYIAHPIPGGSSDAYAHNIPTSVTPDQLRTLHLYLLKPSIDLQCASDVISTKLTQFVEAMNIPPEGYAQKMIIDFERAKQASVETAFNQVFAAGVTNSVT